MGRYSVFAGSSGVPAANQKLVSVAGISVKSA